MFEHNVNKRDRIRHEARLVKMVLDAMGMSADRGRVYEANRERTGEHPRLTFQDFRATQPDFPLVLAYENLYKLTRHSSCAQHAIISKPHNAIFAQKFRDLLVDLEEELGDRPLGMIFPFGGIRGGLILHNGDFGQRKAHRQSILSWSEDGETRYLQTFYSLLKELRLSSWDPRKDLPQTVGSPNFAVLLMPHVKDHGVLRVLTFFCHHQFYGTQDECDEIGLEILREQGHRWIAIRKTDLTNATGLSINTVKRAVRALQAKGILDSRKIGRRNCYRVTRRLHTDLIPEDDDD